MESLSLFWRVGTHLHTSSFNKRMCFRFLCIIIEKEKVGKQIWMKKNQNIPGAESYCKLTNVYLLFLHMTKLRNWWTFEGIISCKCAFYFSIFWKVCYNCEILCFLEVWWNSSAVVPECGFLCENFRIIVALFHFFPTLLVLFLWMYFHFISVFKMFGIQLFIVLS